MPVVAEVSMDFITQHAANLEAKAEVGRVQMNAPIAVVMIAGTPEAAEVADEESTEEVTTKKVRRSKTPA